MHTENRNDIYKHTHSTTFVSSNLDILITPSGTLPFLSQSFTDYCSEATRCRGGFGLAPLLFSRTRVGCPDTVYSTFISSCSSLRLHCPILYYHSVTQFGHIQIKCSPSSDIAPSSSEKEQERRKRQVKRVRKRRDSPRYQPHSQYSVPPTYSTHLIIHF